MTSKPETREWKLVGYEDAGIKTRVQGPRLKPMEKVWVVERADADKLLDIIKVYEEALKYIDKSMLSKDYEKFVPAWVITVSIARAHLALAEAERIREGK